MSLRSLLLLSLSLLFLFSPRLSHALTVLFLAALPLRAARLSERVPLLRARVCTFPGLG